MMIQIEEANRQFIENYLQAKSIFSFCSAQNDLQRSLARPAATRARSKKAGNCKLDFCMDNY